MRKSRFSDYEVYFYGSGIKSSPQEIISQDNNREILGACVLPKTKQQLRQLGIPISDTQIKLLRKWRLIKSQDESLATSFSILSKEKILKLRKSVQTITPVISQSIRHEFEKFQMALSTQSSVNPYLLFFAYVVDGLVWDCFTKENLMPDMTIKGNKDLWVGILWGSYSPRSFFLGTNEYPIGGGVIKFIWNNDLLPKLKTFFLHPNDIPKMIKDLPIPIIHQKPGDQIYENSLRLSQKLVSEVINNLDLPLLVKQYKFHNEKEALVIVYHELMWDLLDEMEKSGLIIKPPLLKNPHEVDKSNLTNLIFKVHTN